MENQAKKVLLTSNGDEISMNIALHLAKRGCRLVLMGNECCLRSVKDNIMDSTNSAVPVEVVGLDMEDEREGAFDEAVDKAWKVLGSLDALVHCYAFEGKMQDHLQLAEEEFRKIVKINFMAAWFLLKAVGRRMRDYKTGGSIVFLTTILSAERGLYQGAAAYGSCLAGVQQLARVSALEIGKYKIRVNAIARGLHLQDEFPMSVGKDRAEKLVKEAMPLHRWLDVKNDLASTVIYLISDGSRYMTGTTIFVDGAQSLVRPRMRSYM
ncbi:NAD(P)-binding Rossmann-fold superfamily protein isoform 1 [Theobroma cacao]|uniref:NAD(P)-binding Rossmann-fold superfamily protein isoform 1 n=1 Tax=Theobroma cacao TaxID=3641 RepID=A0A061EEK7_THECC|nr:NAD(P)-binding Rossmann-fold superfamily protein isoform 1 [Theobroma cacao]EOY02843.1 NAD(P)-binding Rossmann-fold superfamily protein isoform 1 [Theobroma cacao]